MRTNEGTYLQKLMQDSDRKTDLHQLGCDYLVQKGVVEKLFSYIGEDVPNIPYKKDCDEIRDKNIYYDTKFIKRLIDPKPSISVGSQLSRPLQSNGKYTSFIVGYLDVFLSIKYEFNWVSLYSGKRRSLFDFHNPPSSEEFEEKLSSSYEKSAIIEVKGHKQSPHDILQQMQTYMANVNYYPEPTIILATMYPIPKSEKELYANHRIKHIWIDVEKAKALMAEKNKEMDTESF